MNRDYLFRLELKRLFVFCVIVKNSTFFYGNVDIGYVVF